VTEALGDGPAPAPGETAPTLPPSATVTIPPLAAAIAQHAVATARVLLTHGADPNALALERYGLLYLAALDCNPEMTRLLVQFHATARVGAPADRPATVACDGVRVLLPKR